MKFTHTIPLLVASLVIGCAETGPEPPLEYAVKFVCGPADGPAVAPGTYFTAINVHNPTADTIRLRRKVARTAADVQGGRVSVFSNHSLLPDQAMEFECRDILRMGQSIGDVVIAEITGFHKGFVLIHADERLDVVAVYTAMGATGQVETMDVERVSPHPLGRVPSK